MVPAKTFKIETRHNTTKNWARDVIFISYELNKNEQKLGHLMSLS
jgi:hypothetical protein